MVLRSKTLVIVLGLLAVVWLRLGVAQARADDAQAILGLWHGSWGGDQRDGAIFTPVIAEMVIEGDRIELHDFPQVGQLQGTVRIDSGKQRMRITPAAPAVGKPVLKDLEYNYELAGDKLTLRIDDKEAVSLQKIPVVAKPLANVQAELVGAAELNEAGDLLVTRVTALKANATGTMYYQAEPQKLRTKQASIYVVQENELKAVTLELARELLHKAPPAVLAFRQDEQSLPPKLHELWKTAGSAAPDSEAALQTIARSLRPGTLVFVLSARENIPQP